MNCSLPRPAPLGVPCQASQVLVVSGSQQALDLAAKLYIDKGTQILLEGPTYLAALQIFQLFGAECLTVQLETDGEPGRPACQP